uniref:Reverse transcriptase n=1 Tax=Cannabis sativa TaxID=3483 RepID=A0A803QRD8_CANSA
MNPPMMEVVKKEMLKLLGVGIFYPISDSKWVSPVQVVPKKLGITVVKNEDNDLVPIRMQVGWRVCIDYLKLNAATRKDHFPLPFIDQMLERLAGHPYYCFLDGYSGYNQIAIARKINKRQLLHAPLTGGIVTPCDPHAVRLATWGRVETIEDATKPHVDVSPMNDHRDESPNVGFDLEEAVLVKRKRLRPCVVLSSCPLRHYDTNGNLLNML